MITLRDIHNGESYASRHLVHGDYYSEHERVQGQWLGKGAAQLGLQGEVDLQCLENIRQGLDPKTGEKLRARKSVEKVLANGDKKNPIAFIDLAVSAPKSVSIMQELGNDGRLLEAHNQAVRDTLGIIERAATTRVQKGGKHEERITGNLIAAAFTHDASRELDPQIHTHLVVGNLTYDEPENQWKALRGRPLYDQSPFFTECYRNLLAKNVLALGYEIEQVRDANGKYLGFEIAGIDQELRNHYSQRSAARDEAVAGFTKANGRAPSTREIAVLIRETRSDKLEKIERESVKEKQNQRLTPHQAATIQDVRQKADSRTPSHQPLAAAKCLEHAIDHCFERSSVIRDHELLAESLRYGCGRVELADLEGELRRLEKSRVILRAGNQITTKDALEREKAIVAAVNQGRDQYERLGGKAKSFEPSAKLNEQQRQAVRSVLDSTDGFLFLRGAAGAGKTSTLEEISKGLRASGKTLAAFAPSHTATEELQKRGFSDAMTLQRLLLDEKAQAGLAGKVVVLDEASMVSSKQMHQFIGLAQKHKARVLFSGDTRQLNAVEAGDVLRVLESQSKLRAIELNKVERQTNADYKKAIETLRRDPQKGLEHLESIGAVAEISQENRATAVALAYSAEQAKLNAKGERRSVLVVCSTNEEVNRVNEAIRADRKEWGELGQGQEKERLDPLHWTSAQKSDARNFKAGQLLLFHKQTRQFPKNAAVEVLSLADPVKNTVRVRTESGLEQILRVNQGKDAFGVFKRATSEICAGDKILLTGSRRERGLKINNGELVQVSQLDPKGQIHLADGRVLPSSYKEWNHGYAVTAHRSQGKTVDSVVISGDRMNRELFYVSASRGKESVRIITSCKDELAESIAVSGRRTSALELVQGDLLQGLQARGQDIKDLAVGLGLRLARSFRSVLQKGLGLDRQSRLSSVLGLNERLHSRQRGEIRLGGKMAN